MDKLLSIIIPSFDMEAYLPRCLGSLVSLDEALLKRLDVIVVNDGSRDRTGEIAHAFARRHPEAVRVVDKPNGHYGSAVNAGLAVATGRYVKNLDADDSFNPAGLSAFLRQLESDCAAGRTIDLYLTNYDHVDGNGRSTYVASYDLPVEGTFGLEEMLAHTARICMHAVTWRLELLREIGYRQSEGIAYSDWEWILYPMLKVRTARYLPVRVYRYLVGRAGQSVSPSERLRNVGAWQVLLDRALALCRTQGDALSPTARDYLFRVTVGMAEMYAETMFLSGPVRDLGAVFSRLFSTLDAVHAGLAAQLEETARIMKSTLNAPYLRIWRRIPVGKALWVLSMRGYLFCVRRFKRTTNQARRI